MAHRYLTSWFLIDLIASLPYELMANDRSYRAFQLIKTVRLLRIRRLMRAWGFVFGANMLRVGTILFGWILVAHWFACGWYGLGWVQRCSWHWSEDTWLTIYWPELATECVEIVLGEGIGGEDLVSYYRRYAPHLHLHLSPNARPRG